MLVFKISIFASDVFVSKNRPKGHGILTFLVMESHEKSWNLNLQKEYEPCPGRCFLPRPSGILPAFEGTVPCQFPQFVCMKHHNPVNPWYASDLYS